MISNSKKTAVKLLPMFFVMTGFISSCSTSDSQLVTSVPFDPSQSPESINTVTPSINGTTQTSASRAGISYPTCTLSTTKPGWDGWGREDSRPCRVVPTLSTASGTPAAPNPTASPSTPTAPTLAASSVTPTPTTACPARTSCGSYPVSGLGSRKQEILNAGGTTLDIAIAMLESRNMGTDYAYGDSKANDAANFGIFKQNWGMLRTTCPYFQRQSQGQWNNGAVLNNNLNADIACRQQSQAYYGLDRWFAGHRYGARGLDNPNTADIRAYRDAVYWIKGQIDSNPANLSNDIRFWVRVPAI